MLENLLHMVGIDLQAQLAQITARANAFKETTKREIRHEIAHVGVTAGLLLGAMMAFALTCLVGLIALYVWLEPQYGALPALAVVAAVTAAATFVLLVVALARGEPAPVAEISPVVVAAPAVARPPLGDVAALMASPPADASLVDVLAHRVSSRAAGAADEAIDIAQDTLANGSRSALIGTLATTILIGFVVGRRGGI
jgi:hypothetical protein